MTFILWVEFYPTEVEVIDLDMHAIYQATTTRKSGGVDAREKPLFTNDRHRNPCVVPCISGRLLSRAEMWSGGPWKWQFDGL